MKPSGASAPLAEDERYAVIGEHARGGLGRILSASDRRLKRPVALKELLRADEEDEARFIREALITARLQHPAIIPIQDVGRWPSGKPYYAMKMVSGRSLAEMVAEKKTLEERLALLPNVIAVADAMAYAHSQRVIHRDLNPSNVLIGPFGETVVIDWGLAVDLSAPFQSVPVVPRRPQSIATVGKPRLTITGAVLGTAEYMPPEQADGKVVDERADVYAIGAILYHVLAGVPPYEGASSSDVMEKVLHQAPVPLEKREPNLPIELLTIVQKAMARDAQARYESALELAGDLKRFQTGQLVSAHDYTAWALTQRWLRRHRVSMAVVGACVALLAAMALVSMRRIIRERLAQESRNQLLLVQARTSLDRDPTSTVAWLKQYPSDGTEWRAVRDAIVQAQSEGVARHVLDTDLALSAFSPDGRVIATAGKGQIELVETETGRKVAAQLHQGSVRRLRFSPDGQTVLFFDRGSTVLHLWRWGDRTLRTLWAHDGAVEEAIFSPDGALVASAGADKTVRLWSTVDDDTKVVLRGHTGTVFLLAFSPDGKWLASAGQDKTVRVWEVGAQRSRVLRGSQGVVLSVAFSPDGQTLAASGMGNTINLWDWRTGSARALTEPGDRIWNIAFSTDGKLLASAGDDGTVGLWDVAGERARFLKADHGVRSLAFSPSGLLVASGGEDGPIRLWDTASGQLLRIWRGHRSGVDQLEFSPDGKTLLSHSLDKTTRIWSVPPELGEVLDGYQDAVFDVAYSPDGKLLASGSGDHRVRVTELATGQVRVLPGHEDMVYRIAFSPDGTQLVSASWDQSLRLWNLRTAESTALRGHQNALWDVQFSPDGRNVASASVDGTVRLWDIRSGESRVFHHSSGEVRSVAFSPDGKMLASGGADQVVRLWDVATGATRTFGGHQDYIYQVMFSLDGKVLASASYDHTVRLWNLDNGESRVLKGHTDRVRSIAFSPDRQHLVSAGEDATIRIWNLVTGRSLVLPGHKEWIIQVAFSPDGRLLASAGLDQTVRVWDAVTGSNLAIYRHDSEVRRIAFSPDGKQLASASIDHTVRLWPVPAQAVPDQPSGLRGWMEHLTTAVMDSEGDLGTH